jgi:hypothetical protein
MKGAIIFTDIVKSSILWNKNPSKMMELLKKHDKIIMKIVKYYGGTVVKTIGDAFMIYIKKIEDAVKLSIEIIDSIDFFNFRIGMCYGPLKNKINKIQNCSLKDFYGTTVNLASRMESKVAKNGTISLCFWNTKPPLNFIEELAQDYDILVRDYHGNCKCKKPKYINLDLECICDKVKKLKGVPEITTFTIFI